MLAAGRVRALDLARNPVTGAGAAAASPLGATGGTTAIVAGGSGPGCGLGAEAGAPAGAAWGMLEGLDLSGAAPGVRGAAAAAGIASLCELQIGYNPGVSEAAGGGGTAAAASAAARARAGAPRLRLLDVAGCGVEEGPEHLRGVADDLVLYPE